MAHVPSQGRRRAYKKRVVMDQLASLPKLRSNRTMTIAITLVPFYYCYHCYYYDYVNILELLHLLLLLLLPLGYYY